MKRTIGIALALCLVATIFVYVSPASAREATIKIGSGVYFDETQIGGNFQVDIPVAKEGKINISPFVDAYVSKKWTKIGGGGLNLLFKGGAGETGKIFFGIGGGFGQARLHGENASGALANALFGGEFSASEKISIFIQGRWLAVFGGLDARHFAIEGGLSFNVGE
jgi:hypothetical protein